MKESQQRAYQQPKSYSIESLGVKQRKAYDVILDHYRTGVDPLCMIIEGTAGTGKSYLIAYAILIPYNFTFPYNIISSLFSN